MRFSAVEHEVRNCHAIHVPEGNILFCVNAGKKKFCILQTMMIFITHIFSRTKCSAALPGTEFNIIITETKRL